MRADLLRVAQVALASAVAELQQVHHHDRFVGGPRRERCDLFGRRLQGWTHATPFPCAQLLLQRPCRGRGGIMSIVPVATLAPRMNGPNRPLTITMELGSCRHPRMPRHRGDSICYRQDSARSSPTRSCIGHVAMAASQLSTSNGLRHCRCDNVVQASSFHGYNCRSRAYAQHGDSTLTHRRLFAGNPRIAFRSVADARSYSNRRTSFVADFGVRLLRRNGVPGSCRGYAPPRRSYLDFDRWG